MDRETCALCERLFHVCRKPGYQNRAYEGGKIQYDAKRRRYQDSVGMRDRRCHIAGGSKDLRRSDREIHDRYARPSNGLGGGFAGYGIYPQYKDQYALHIFYDTMEAREECEKYLNRVFEVVNLSKIPIRKSPKITNEPLIWRYFVTPHHNRLADSQLEEKEYVVRAVIYINTHFTGSYVFSSGKNMGVFKAVGIRRGGQRFTG